jgi:hypothetical protein
MTKLVGGIVDLLLADFTVVNRKEVDPLRI